MMQLEHRLEREILICARPATVFRFFTDSERFASWWGSGSHITPEPGGAVVIRYPNGVVVSGHVESVEPERSITFTYGYEDPGKPIPPGGSRVTITLAESAEGTRLHLLHELADAAARDAHVPGWRFQLSVFANLAASAEHNDLGALMDRFFALWSDPSAQARTRAIEELTEPDVVFRDAFACLAGRDELAAHVGALQQFRPGALERIGDPRACQGTVLVDWRVLAADGEEQGRGTNVVDLAPTGRLRRIVGLAQA
jgi:uncharacterized protein YndB with AHSA1/START domain